MKKIVIIGYSKNRLAIEQAMTKLSRAGLTAVEACKGITACSEQLRKSGPVWDHPEKLFRSLNSLTRSKSNFHK